MNRRVVAIVAGLAVISAAGVLAYRLWLSRPRPEATAVVQRGTIQATVDALGRVEPRLQIGLTARLAGAVEATHAAEGARVDEGAVLLTLEAAQYRSAVEQAERTLELRRLQLAKALEAPSSAEIEVARARLRRATVARQNAQSDYDEIADQPEAESSDEAVDLEAAKLEYRLAQAEFDRVMEGTFELQIELLKGQVRDAEAALQQARDRLEDTRLRAPFAGTVLRLEALVGQLVVAGSTLIQFADLDTLQISAEINEIDIPSVGEKQEVIVRLDAFPTQTLRGQVERISPGATDTRGATTYRALIAVDIESLAVRPGMGANLTIVTREVSDALLLPRRAVRRVGQNQVVSVYRRGRFQETMITTGLSNATHVQILDGLEEGEIVRVE